MVGSAVAQGLGKALPAALSSRRYGFSAPNASIKVIWRPSKRLHRARAVNHTLCTATAGTPSLLAGVDSEEKLLGIVQKMAEAGKVPPQLIPAFLELYGNYKKAVMGSGTPQANEKFVALVMGSIADRVINQFVDPYTFPSYHQRILEPYNYYEFGQRYTESLMDFSNSMLGHIERFDKIQEQLDAGQNVVLLANHQTEADPGVFAGLLRFTHPKLATEVTYVAGDRVVTDALCKPFSMGRNLFCVHSKKHMDDDPATKGDKMAMNRRTLKSMSTKLNQGGCLLWIAPSGGRDRPNPETDEWLPDSFDPSAVALMYQLLNKAKPDGHLYPFAMYSHPIMPPPRVIEKRIGESRVTTFHGVGISVCEEMDTAAILEGVDQADKVAVAEALAKYAHAEVVSEYVKLQRAIEDTSTRSAAPEYAQPWVQEPATAAV